MTNKPARSDSLKDELGGWPNLIFVQLLSVGCPTLRKPRRVGQPVIYFLPEEKIKMGQPPCLREAPTLPTSSIMASSTPQRCGATRTGSW